MGASLMARNIFNQPPRNETESGAPSPTPPKAAKLPGSVGGLRDSLREITANSIRDIEPDQIDMDGLRDRLVLEDSSIDELFIKEMQESGYKPGVIQDALGLTRQGVSNHRVVMDQLPDGFVQLIGPAHGIGRRQWGDLAALSVKVDLVDIAKEALAALPDDTPSSEKFQAVYSACSSKARSDKKPPNRGLTSVINDENGSSLGTLTIDEKAIALKVTKKDNPEFGRWLEEHAEATLLQLFVQWRNERGSGS